MARKSGKCEACLELRPIEGHHKHPLNYGGREDGELAMICAACHDMVHTEGEYYYKHGKSSPTLMGIMQTNRTHATNLAMLASVIVKAKGMFESGMLGAGEQRRMTQISWASDADLRMAHAVKQGMGFKSLERAIIELVKREFLRQQEN